jgi:ABC-type dipeptide/oligopeptide/nickel transport system permease component
VEELKEELGFNRPLPVQFVSFISKAVVVDFGKFFRH